MFLPSWCVGVVAGSQSLHVQYQLEDHFPDQGASPLAMVAAPRADATYADMNAAVAQLEQVAKQVPSVVVVPNPAQPAPAPDRPYVVSLRMDFNNTGAVDVARQLRQKIGVQGDQPGQTENGRVRLAVEYVPENHLEQRPGAGATARLAADPQPSLTSTTVKS